MNDKPEDRLIRSMSKGRGLAYTVNENELYRVSYIGGVSRFAVFCLNIKLFIMWLMRSRKHHANSTKTKEERYKELLNNVIDHFSAGESCHALIDKLLDIGFEPAELVHDFNFSVNDVEDRLLERMPSELEEEW